MMVMHTPWAIINKSSGILVKMPIGMWGYNSHPGRIIKELILARPGSKGTTVIVVMAAALLCTLAYKNMSKVPAPPPATRGNCTQEAIRQVDDPMERAILSGQCAKQPATTGANAK
jgi:hypothetical protein